MGLALLHNESSARRTEPFLYHDPNRKGFVPLLRKQPGARVHQTAYKLEHLPEALANLDLSGDVWISQNEFFWPDRKLIHVARMPVCFLDVDTYKVAALAGCSPEVACARLLQAFADQNVPEPSLVLFSGRGLQLKWVLEQPASSRAVPRWQAVQRQLCAQFASWGADSKALDISRVLRLEGSFHSGSREQVRVLHRASVPTLGALRRHDGLVVHAFDVLADTLLPFTRHELEERRRQEAEERAGWDARREERAARTSMLTVIPGGKAERRGSLANLRPFVRSELAWDRIADVRKLFQLRGWTSGAPEGQRDVPVYLCASFLAEARLAKDVRAELVPLVRELAPTWTQAEINSCIASVMGRAQATARGETVKFRGRDVPPLYWHRNATLIDRLGITPEEERQMATIISKTEKARRACERQRAKRRADGAVPRDDYLQSAAPKRVQVQALRNRGLSLRGISAELGIPLTSVQRYCGT
jgi:hypothetical protein